MKDRVFALLRRRLLMEDRCGLGDWVEGRWEE